MPRRSLAVAGSLVVLGLTVLAPVATLAADAPGAPGIASAWTTGAKQGLGTSTTAASKVWYTIAQGITDEVYYPQTDTPDVQDLQYVVTDGSSFVDLERDATTHQVSLADSQSLTYQQVNTAANGRYRITKTYVTDPDRPALLIQTRFQVLSGAPLRLFALYNPSLNNSGMGDSGATVGGQLVASDGPVASALAASTGFAAASSGYSGTTSDGFQDLQAHRALTSLFDSANTPGNLVQTAQVTVGSDTTFTLALAFGASRTDAATNASASLAAGWASVSASYQSDWHAYVASLHAPPASVTSTGLTQQYVTALMMLKAHEDKTFNGAFVASLTIPWGNAANADSCCTAGYHAVWARDQYHIATAFLAAGDAAAANRALDYLFTVQERSDGSYPQNTRLNGTPVFGSLQMDEVAFPIVLDWQLGRFDSASYAKVKASADYLVAHGPSTPEERWEEAGGWSPSTIAAEIAGLVTAADVAQRNGDGASASRYLSAADSWRGQVDAWTATSTGHLAGGSYYERIDDDANPDDGHTLCVANGGGCFDERDVVDGGFLDLVRLGVKPFNDARVVSSLGVIDQTIRTSTPEGDLWHRYNHDGYGETAAGAPFTGAGVGRLWPLLSGERGEYALAAGQPAGSAAALATMAGAANQGLLIPEQVWDQPSGSGFTLGQGTGSATPLAWSLAQFVRLAVSISAGHDVETPSVVAARYVASRRITVTVPSTTDATGRTVFLAGTLSGLGSGLPDWSPAGIAMTRVDATHWTAVLTGPAGASLQYKYTLGDWDHVEKGAGCVELGNRSLTLASGTQGDTVVNWRNVSPCGA
ncbi:MAG TPA: glucan 1,4-alpha-glucosidase [Candidatus Dormibacteraeota bacterium]|nr:glucan 1,4-alpha-glucosidase [Candidatus Dormibacteraeota bacterium]